MLNNRGNQTEVTIMPSNDTDQDLAISDSEVEMLTTQLEMTIPADAVSPTFYDSLLSKIIDIQARESQ